MILYLRFKRNNKAFLYTNFTYFLVYYFEFNFLVFPIVTICNILGDCCNFFTFMYRCFIIEKKNFFTKCDLICKKLWSHLLKKSLMENVIFRDV